MSDFKGLAQLCFVVTVGFISPASVGAEAPASTTIATIDLSASFSTLSNWRFSASQGPPVDAGASVSGVNEPGEIHLCLERAASGICDPQVQPFLINTGNDDYYSKPHYLNTSKVVRGVHDRPLLLVKTASLQGGNGDQLVFTQALAYRRISDEFVRVYGRLSRKNNSQDVRFIESGWLKGDIISVEPTENAPFGFWVSVNVPTASAYKEVLRYRSATRYGDGNPLSVVDSEMPNIEQRLGFWRLGSPLPLPASPCPKPHLIRMELWCN